jgi:hypothetical protein
MNSSPPPSNPNLSRRSYTTAVFFILVVTLCDYNCIILTTFKGNTRRGIEIPDAALESAEPTGNVQLWEGWDSFLRSIGTCIGN